MHSHGGLLLFSASRPDLRFPRGHSLGFATERSFGANREARKIVPFLAAGLPLACRGSPCAQRQNRFAGSAKKEWKLDGLFRLPRFRFQNITGTYKHILPDEHSQIGALATCMLHCHVPQPL
jgi:hypothetical protein